MEIATKPVTAWVLTRRRTDNLLIMTEQSLRNKVFALNLDNREFSIFKGGAVRIVLGELLRVDMSPEALLEDLDISEGQRLLIIPGSGVAG